MTTSRLKSGASLPEASRSGNAGAESAPARLNRARWPAFFVIALLGLAVRLPQLSVRPMHTDEAVNAYIVGELLAGEPFTYDPQDRHGPALAAVSLPLVRMRGARSFADLTESELRLTSVAAGTFTILLFGAAADTLEFFPCLIAALLFAVAPLPVYYDRYFIHESLFCAASFGLIVSSWRVFSTRSTGYAAVAGGCAALMFACKETAVLHFLALTLACLVFRLRNGSQQTIDWSVRFRQLLAGSVTFLVVIVALFTLFDRSLKSLEALSHVVSNVLSRAAGQGHEQPFWYYCRLLAGGWSGALLVALACVGLLVAISRYKRSPYEWLAYYGLLLAVIYSSIPYKTPWLALNLWLPMAILAALAIVFLWRWASAQTGRRRVAIPAFGILAVAMAMLIAHDTRKRVFLFPADENNPYAYAHTSEDVLGLSAEITEIAGRDGIKSPRIAVIAADAWPLPWYLRHFQQVGFWQPGQQVPDADFYVTSTDAANQYADRLRGYRPDFFGSRPGVLVLLWLPEPK
jgi:uncharacterized protein (TIGR03663 family)